MKSRFILILIIAVQFLYPCTSAVISGKAAADGRPLLWKHRDSDFLENKVVFIQSEEHYDYIGIANTVDTLSREIWMGSNETGFSIMNTASYNLNEGQTCSVADDQEGIFMRQALESCATLTDFETFLDTTAGKRGVAANFGVIDAQGGAAYYETGYYNYTKYDAKDPQTAPDGYLLRTNFSCSGSENGGTGYIRFNTAEQLFRDEFLKNKLNVPFILLHASRNLTHSLTGTHLLATKMNHSPYYVPFNDYIVRWYSASVMLVQGVKPGENPDFTTIWTIPGFSLTTLTVPLWVKAGVMIPAELTSQNGNNAAYNQCGLNLKKKLFTVERGNGNDYIDLSRLIQKKKKGLYYRVLAQDESIIKNGQILMQGEYKNKTLDMDRINRFYEWLIPVINQFYETENDQMGIRK